MVKDIIVGANYGFKDWLIQRATAAIMALYTVVLAVYIFCLSPLDYDSWRGIFAGTGLASTAMRFATFLFIVSLTYHAWVGVRDIWMDYVKSTGLRLTLHVLTLLALIGNAGWAVQILWRL